MPISLTLTKIVYIAAGGALGSILRYVISGWVQSAAGSSFPAGTLLVNATGCLAIGFLATVFTGPILIREEYRVAILIGVLGGFTTFSTYGRETLALAADRQYAFAGLNILLSNTLGLTGVWLGTRIAERLYGL